MNQTEARQLAQELGWLATTRDEHEGRWESTREWIVVDPNSGEAFASREEAQIEPVK